jgi:hypothetical protein
MFFRFLRRDRAQFIWKGFGSFPPEDKTIFSPQALTS